MKKRDVERFLNLHTNAFKKKSLNDSVGVSVYTSELHMHGILEIEKILEDLGVVVKREDWGGNEQEGTNYDKVSFVWNGVNVFGLVNKEEGSEE